MTGMRYVHKRSRSAEAADLLQAIFAAELISPSRALVSCRAIACSGARKSMMLRYR